MAVAATDGGCRVTVANTGESFACARDQLILDAGLDAGIGLAHNCRGGACGTCKSQVLEGEVDHGWVMNFAITDEEKAAGKCLICQSRPRSDRLVIRTDGEVTTRGLAPVPIEVTGMVVAAEALTPSIRRLVVALPAAVDFRYHAGMHVQIKTPGAARARTYSIATTPDAEGRPPDGLLEFFVTRHEGGGASGWLHGDDLVGGPLTLHGPHGSFTWPAATSDPVLCLAGGSGLAPLLSMVGHALAAGPLVAGAAPPQPIVLVLSVRNRGEVLGLDLLHALGRHHPRFRHVATLTQAGPGAVPADWRRGRVPDWLGEELPELTGWRVLAAGPPGFVDACVTAAQRLGARDEHILTDSFTPTVDP